MTKNNYTKDFIKCLEDIDRTKNSYDIFQDFITMAALSLQNATLKSAELEQEYLSLVKQYNNPNKFAELLAITAAALENKMQDFLGEVYMQAGFGNKNNGQFFTPYHVSKLMADVTIDYESIEKVIAEQGYFTASDPCCGGGSMFIAVAESLKEKGYNPQKVLMIQGIDIDLKCCQMSYIQTSLLGLTGAIIHGNSLTLETWKTFVTPLSYINPYFIKNKSITSPVTTAKIIQFRKPEQKQINSL